MAKIRKLVHLLVFFLVWSPKAPSEDWPIFLTSGSAEIGQFWTFWNCTFFRTPVHTVFHLLTKLSRETIYLKCLYFKPYYLDFSEFLFEHGIEVAEALDLYVISAKQKSGLTTDVKICFVKLKDGGKIKQSKNFTIVWKQKMFLKKIVFFNPSRMAEVQSRS